MVVSFVTRVVAVGGGLLSGLQGVFEGPSRSLAMISSSMADIEVLSSHLASGTFLLTISCISDGILLIRTGHSRFPYVSSFTFSDARLLMWELRLSNKRRNAFTFSGAAEGRSVWGGSQVPTSFITMSYIYSTV